MLWIVEESLLRTPAERKARLNFIKEVSGDKRVSWQKLSCNFLPANYYYCNSDDGMNGVFATIHMYQFGIPYFLRFLRPSQKDFFVLNTCKLKNGIEIKLLTWLRKMNPEIQLFFAKQEYDVEFDLYTNNLCDVGEFGFMTSKSERIMFRNLDKGLMEAVARGFEVVVLEEEGDQSDEG